MGEVTHPAAPDVDGCLETVVGIRMGTDMIIPPLPETSGRAATHAPRPCLSLLFGWHADRRPPAEHHHRPRLRFRRPWGGRPEKCLRSDHRWQLIWFKRVTLCAPLCSLQAGQFGHRGEPPSHGSGGSAPAYMGAGVYGIVKCEGLCIHVQTPH